MSSKNLLYGTAALAVAGGVYLLSETATKKKVDVVDFEKPKRTWFMDAILQFRANQVRFGGWFVDTVLIPPKEGGYEDVEVERSEGSGESIKCRVFPRKETNDSKLPIVYIDLHGGGWMAGKPQADDEFCRYIHKHLDCVIVSVDYRLSPEHPYPAAIEDIISVVNWVEKQYPSVKIAIGGFSAGGNLSLGASVHPKVRGRIQLVAAFYPPTDLSHHSLADFPEKNPFKRNLFYEAYLLKSELGDLKDPCMSPLYADPEAFPPYVYINGGGLGRDREPNRLDILALIDKLQGRKGGIKFKSQYFDEMFHAWTHIPEWVGRRVGTSKKDGGEGDAVEIKWMVYDELIGLLKECISSPSSKQ
jgi:acetyl esterase/lipase